MTIRSQYIKTLVMDMRHALAKFHHYDRMWNELNDAFKVKIRTENQRRNDSGRFPHTPLGVAQQKDDNLALKDAMSAATWWRDKAAMLAAVIAAEESAARMLRGE